MQVHFTNVTLVALVTFQDVHFEKNSRHLVKAVQVHFTNVTLVTLVTFQDVQFLVNNFLLEAVLGYSLLRSIFIFNITV